MNRQQILSRLALRYTVLYSNGALSTWDLGKAAWRHASWTGAFDHRDGVIIDRPPAALLRLRGHRWTDSVTLPLVTRRWRRRLARDGRAPLVAYVFHPRLWPYVEPLGADVVVYHAYDQFKLQVGWSDAIAADERSLIRRADIVVGSSDVICEDLRAQGATAPTLIPNAADFEAFSSGRLSAEPNDLSPIPSPRLGYVGKISRKVDLHLVGDLARSHPTWQFVFVGSHDTPDAESRAGIAALGAVPNVHFLGFKPHTSLPAYATRMDVNLICHRLDDDLWTKGTFPLKLYEYLAAGPPVVSADIPAVRQHADVVTIVRDAEEWQQALSAIVEHGRDAVGARARQAVAAVNTWNARVDVIDGLLQEALSRPRSPHSQPT